MSLSSAARCQFRWPLARLVVAWRRQPGEGERPGACCRDTMTYEIRTEIGIDASPARVWAAVLADFPDYPDWNPFTLELQGEIRQDSRIKYRFEFPRGIRIWATDILRFEPVKELRWAAHFPTPGMFNGEHYFVIERECCQCGIPSRGDLQRCHAIRHTTAAIEIWHADLPTIESRTEAARGVAPLARHPCSRRRHDQDPVLTDRRNAKSLRRRRDRIWVWWRHCRVSHCPRRQERMRAGARRGEAAGALFRTMHQAY